MALFLTHILTQNGKKHTETAEGKGQNEKNLEQKKRENNQKCPELQTDRSS